MYSGQWLTIVLAAAAAAAAAATAVAVAARGLCLSLLGTRTDACPRPEAWSVCHRRWHVPPPPSPQARRRQPLTLSVVDVKSVVQSQHQLPLATASTLPRALGGSIVRTTKRCTAWPDILFAVVSVYVGVCMYEYVGVRGCACVSCMCPFFLPFVFRWS